MKRVDDIIPAHFHLNSASRLPSDIECDAAIRASEAMLSTPVENTDRLADHLFTAVITMPGVTSRMSTQERGIVIAAFLNVLKSYPAACAYGAFDAADPGSILYGKAFLPSPGELSEWCERWVAKQRAIQASAEAAKAHRAKIAKERADLAREAEEDRAWLAEQDKNAPSNETPAERRARIAQASLERFRASQPPDLDKRGKPIERKANPTGLAAGMLARDSLIDTLLANNPTWTYEEAVAHFAGLKAAPTDQRQKRGIPDLPPIATAAE